MSDDGETGDNGEYGGFVFEDESLESEPGLEGVTEGDDRRLVAVVVLVAALVVLAYVAQPFVMGAVSGLLGADGGSGAESGPSAGGSPTVTNDTSTGTGATTRTGATTEDGATIVTSRSPTEGTPVSTTTTTTRTATRTSASSPSQTSSPTATPPATRTRSDSDRTGDSEGEDGTQRARSPAIEAFILTDRSGSGTATFDIGWNVSDPDRDLVGVRITLVADPDGEAQTVSQRRFDAGGARSAGTTTFEVPEGSGDVYEVSIEVTDQAGNSAFELTRAVADGAPED